VNEAAFAALVERVERLSTTHPRRYRLGLWAWIGLGYLAFGATLGLAVAMAALLVGAVGMGLARGSVLLALGGGIELLVILVVLGGALLRILTLRVPQPEGRPVTRAEAPQLFAVLDALRGELGAPALDAVLLTASFNAGVAVLPRVGTLPFYRRVLLLGLPLLRTLGPDELRAVLAHELGHLSRKHGAAAGRIYQLRLAWMHVADGLARAGGGGGVALFLRWYLPRFSAWTFVVSRRHEDEADDAAARIAGRDTSAAALVRTALAGRALETFWPAEIRSSLASAPDPATPPADILARLGRHLAQAPQREDAESELVALLLQPSPVDDTHPSLAHRLARLDRAGAVPAPIETSAAEAILGDLADRVESELGARMKRAVAPAWRHQVAELRRQTERLAALDADITQGRLDPERLMERAMLMEMLRGPEAGLEAWRVAASLARDHPAARFHLGRLLLVAADDPQGLELLTALCAQDPRHLPAVTAALVPWLRSHGRAGEADDWLARARDHQDGARAAEADRTTVHRSDTLELATLPADRRTALVAALRSTVGLQQAILAQKRASEDEDGEPLRILLVRMSAPTAADRAEAFSALVGWFDEPGHWTIVDESAPRWLWRKARALGDEAVLPV
jgi:hypothetical protein